MEGIRYIQATHNDIPLLIDFRILFGNEVSGSQDFEAETRLRKNLQEYFKKELNKTYYSWHAVCEDKIVAIGGMAIRSQPGNVLNPSGLWAYIVGIYTIPEFRRRSLSDKIVQQLVQTGKEMNITAFELHSTKAGENLYLKNGFKLQPQPTYRKYI